MALNSNKESTGITDNEANGFFLLALFIWFYDWWTSGGGVGLRIRNFYPGLNILDFSGNLTRLWWVILAFVTVVVLFTVLKYLATRRNLQQSIWWLFQKISYKVMLTIVFVVTFAISLAYDNFSNSIIHLVFALFIYFGYIERYHDDDASAFHSFLFWFIIDMFGRSIVPAISNTNFVLTNMDKIGVTLWALDSIFIMPAWAIYMGFHIRSESKSGKLLFGIFWLIMLGFLFSLAMGIAQEDIHNIKVTKFDRKDLDGKYCDSKTIQEARDLVESGGINALTMPRINVNSKEEAPYLEGIDCDFPWWEYKLYYAQLLFKFKKGSRNLSERASKTYDEQILQATGGYYEGQIDEAEKDEDLGVFIEEVDYAKPVFFKDRPSIVVAKIKGKSRDKPIPVAVGCEVMGFDSRGKAISLEKGIIISDALPEMNFQIYGNVERDVSCKINRLPENAKFVRFNVEYKDSILSSLKTYFMNAEALMALDPEKDPLDVYGITDKEPIARSTFGPFIIGMKTKDPPIGISLAERAITNPQLILGITLDNQWEGKISEIVNMKLQLPNGLEIENLYCSTYKFKTPSGNMEINEEGFVEYVLDKEATEEKFLTKIPEDSELTGGQKGNVNFFCTLHVFGPEKLLGNTPIALKFFRLTVDYKYKTYKDYKVILAEEETAVDPSSYFATTYRRPEIGCTLKQTEGECSVNFCYPIYEKLEEDEKISYKYIECRKCSDYGQMCSQLINKEQCEKDPCRHLCYWNEEYSNGQCMPIDQELLASYAINGLKEQMMWPTSSNKVKSCFGPSNKGFRYGIDIDVEDNKEVYAVERGVVTNIIYSPISGVEIEHFPDFRSRYYYIKDIMVEIGKYVEKGEILGKTGFEYEGNKEKTLYFEIVYGSSSSGTSRANPLIYDTGVKRGFYNPSNIFWGNSGGSGLISDISIDFKKDSNCCDKSNEYIFRMDNYGTCEGEY